MKHNRTIGSIKAELLAKAKGEKMGSGFGNSVLTCGFYFDMLPVWLVDRGYILPALSTM